MKAPAPSRAAERQREGKDMVGVGRRARDFPLEALGTGHLFDPRPIVQALSYNETDLWKRAAWPMDSCRPNG